MNKRDLNSYDPLGVEAGYYVPVPMLGDSPLPPPRNLRLAVLATLALMFGAAATVVYTVPAVTHTWHVVSYQTEKVLGRILGRAEIQTAEFLGNVNGGDQPPVQVETLAPQIH